MSNPTQNSYQSNFLNEKYILTMNDRSSGAKEYNNMLRNQTEGVRVRIILQ